VRAQQAQWLGTVQLARPPAPAWLVLFFAAAALALVGFVSLGHYTRTATLTGTLAPDGSVVLVVPAALAASLHPGQAARLRFEACPTAACPPRAGRVVAVSRVPLAVAERTALGLPAAGAARYRVRVRPDSEAVAGTALPAGMEVRASVALERRRIVGWLFGGRAAAT
jgi:multidrug efflux pump subunit AcrA (membrane-fusion protein)